MTASAKALHLTQGAVSQKIARLEALSRNQLVTREHRGLSLTPAGERLLAKARQMLAVNDEIWSEMSGNAVDGVVRLGLPVDLVGTVFVPVLRGFLEAFPKVDLQLSCGSSEELRRGMEEGRLDLMVVEEPVASATGECLMIDRLVWVGMVGGTAHRKSPLPISLVADTCCFRPAILAALEKEGRKARAVFDNGGLEATLASIRMDMAVSAWLASTVATDLNILNQDAGLPSLPSYAITLHRPNRACSQATNELARHLSDGFKRSQASMDHSRTKT
ncbi:LysR family transcriptional regulator [Rhizobium tumorigenes]